MKRKKKENITLGTPPKKSKIVSKEIDSSISRSNINLVIGSDAQRTNFPLPNSDINEHEFFNGDKCLNCNFKYKSNPAKRNHINIFRKKSDVVHIPELIFDINKHMVIV